MDYKARAHELRRSAGSVEEMTAALDAEGIPYQVREAHLKHGEDEYHTRIEVLVPHEVYEWEAVEPFYVPD